MLKKIVLAVATLIATTSVAYAAAPYVGIGTGVKTNTNNNASFRGMPLNLFAGYGGVLNQNFYLAGEVFGTAGTAELDNHGAGLKSTYGYGASIIPGLMLSDRTLAYVRGGVVRTHFKAASNDTVTGGQLGLGLQTSLAQNFDLRGEYNYVAYRSFSGVSSPKSDEFNLGLVYKFD